MVRMSEAQLAFLGWGPNGGPKLAPDIPRPAPPPQAAPPLQADPDGFDFINMVYQGPIVGKGRARASHQGGVFRLHTPKRTIEVEGTFKACLKLARSPGFQLLDFSLLLLVLIRYPIPGSWPKKKQADALARRIRPKKRPDVDNVLKLINDAANKVIWLDDAQVDAVALDRIYVADPEPSIWLRVRRAPMELLGGEPP